MVMCNWDTLSIGCNNEAHLKRWLSTTGSQIFFMQLGFLCYEVGFVKKIWTQSVILKNIEDTFVGILIFLAFGFTLSESPDSFYGIISIPENPFLIGISAHKHAQVLISAFFASTCATIISGAILERMKNQAYVCWCLLTILVNYSFVSHWVWHPSGWLNQLGFIDGAGSVVVHSTAGMAALIAVWDLGARRESTDKQGQLTPIKHASRPIINAMGVFFLWFGWFAFNVSSPIAFSRGIGDAIGTTALVTVISPISAVTGAFLWMYVGIVPLSFESLLSCLLAGLVSITGMCHTCGAMEAVFVGFIASIVYFTMSRVVREKWSIDDPLHVVVIHLCCGMFSGITEGIIANDVYGLPGLIRGEWKHFVVQILGVTVIVVFNFVLSMFLWHVVLKRCLFYKTDIRVNILDIYLGTRLFDQNYDMALDEVIVSNCDRGRKMLWLFHQYIADRYAAEQVDFLIAVKMFNNYLKSYNNNSPKTAKYMLQIIGTYIDENSSRCINISGTQRSVLHKFKNELILELKNYDIKETEAKSDALIFTSPKEHLFDGAYRTVWKTVIPHFIQFLRSETDNIKRTKFQVKVPFKLQDDWSVVWDQQLTKKTSSVDMEDVVPEIRDFVILIESNHEKQLNAVDGEVANNYIIH